MKAPLRIIVIGLGKQSIEDHLPAIEESRMYELVGVVDTDLSRAEEIGSQYKVIFASSTEEILDLLPSPPDVTLIAVPHCDYLPIIRQLSKQTIHIIKEKPFATSIEEALEMKNIMDTTGISIQVTLQRRFNPIFVSFNQLIKRVGKIYSIEGRYTMNIPRLDEGWRSSRALSRGGALMDMGYHYVDLIVWYFGLPSHVTCRLSGHNRDNQNYDVEDTALLNFTYNENGGDDDRILGNLIISRVYPHKEESLTVYGSKGSVKLQRGRVCRLDISGNEIEVLERSGAWPSALIDQLETFAERIIDGKAYRYQSMEYLKHIALIEAAYESSINHDTRDPAVYLEKLITPIVKTEKEYTYAISD